MISDGISPSLSDLLHSVWQSLVPSMLLKMALFLIKFKNSFFKLEINTSGKLPADPVVRTRYCQWRRQGFYFWSGIAHQKKKKLAKIRNQSVKFSHSIMSNSLWPHGWQHNRSPCPSPTPRVYSNSCPLSQWCHPTSSPSVAPIFSCPQPLPASGAFPASRLFPSGGQSIGASASTTVLLMTIQGR